VDVEILMTSKILLYDLGLAKYQIKPMGFKEMDFLVLDLVLGH
jgi:hypothetical protein